MIVTSQKLGGGGKVLVFFGALILLASLRDATAGVNRKFEPRYRAVFEAARTNWLAGSTNVVRAWKFSRAAFDLAEFATNDAQRAGIARQGIEAARAALAQDDKCAPAHYYLAMNLGQRARTELFGALRLVSEMEKHFKAVAKLDPTFDYGGADRNLGILYREAPGWPASIGSRSKARAHLKKSVELSPVYPANHLELLQCYVDWKEADTARKMIADVEQCLVRARSEFTGENWEWSWDDWDQMWTTLQQRLQKLGR